jgi:putative hydroxymethylpyrimidine transport system substrate-binding protein
MKRFWCAAVGAAVLALLTGCGGGGRSDEPARTVAEPSVEAPADNFLTLDGRAGAENVGVLIAKERGYFKELGISIGVAAPIRPRRPIWYVSNRTVDLGIAQQPQVLLAKDKGAPVTVVGSLLSHSTLSMIWFRGSKISDIADLKGKTIAFPGLPYQRKILLLLLARAGLNPEEVKIEPVGYNLVPALVRGRADAIFGGSWNLEGAVLKSRGLNPVVTPVRRLGVPAYDEFVVIARGRRVSQSPDFIRRFMAAVARGTAVAVDNPEAAVRAIEKSPEGENKLGHMAIKAEVEATLPLLSRTGRLSRSHTDHLVSWMLARGLIRRKPVISELQVVR